MAIGRIGLLRGRRHTSNGLDYLRSTVPGYADAAGYVDVPAVRDRGLITASGLGDVEFARELFEELNVLSAEDRAVWATMFRERTVALSERCGHASRRACPVRLRDQDGFSEAVKHMSRQEGWTRWAELIVFVLAALVLALVYAFSRLSPS